jgi:hypothetical protein
MVATVSPIQPGIDVGVVIDAMRSIQTESDRWHLAEVLAARIPEGVKGFGEILDRASKEGVAGKLSVNTLRLYRDTAKRWPSDKRVVNVSFSAHREAMAAHSIEDGRRLLADLVKTQGADKVTVASVRKAVQIKNGTAKPSASKGTATPPRSLDVLADLTAGAPKIIAAIVEGDANLDAYQRGLTKALAHVEKLRAKASRKAASAKKAPASKAAPAKATAAKKVAGAKKAGDLRGM